MDLEEKMLKAATKYASSNASKWDFGKGADWMRGELEAENKELTNDYDRVVKKFDTCRASIATTVKNLGGDPSDTSKTPDNEPWHVFLIRELERLLKTKP